VDLLFIYQSQEFADLTFIISIFLFYAKFKKNEINAIYKIFNLKGQIIDYKTNYFRSSKSL